MSRVRILNLPRECTEASLKQHLTSKLPPTAPHVEVTDCSIKRGPDGKSVRMGFVGFKTAAAGQFVIKHFNNAYFQNCKLHLESATGLNESLTTKNLKKRLEASGGTSKLPSYLKDGEEAAESVARHLKRGREYEERLRGGRPGGASLEDAAEDPKSKGNNKHNTSVAPDSDSGLTDAERKLKERRTEFIAGRLNATQAPSWTGEVLVPLTNPVASSQAVVEEINPEDVERSAIEKQQTLGSVGDMDFLASLAAGPSSSTPSAATTATIGSGVQKEHTAQPDEYEGELEEAAVASAPAALQKPSPADVAESDVKDLLRSSQRVLVRGVPFSATEDEIKNYFSSKIGTVEAVHIPLTRDTKQSKGCAFVKFASPGDAVRCYDELQGAVLMGRLIKVQAVEEDPYAKKAEATAQMANRGAAGPVSEFKSKRLEAKKASDASGVSWNSTYVNMHTAVESVAKRVGAAAHDMVSVEHQGAAVRAAIAEAVLTSEVKQVLGDEGIDLDALNSRTQNALKARSNVTILVKNIPSNADLAQLAKMFLKFGVLDAAAVPTSGGFALYRFVHAQDARAAFQRLAYKPFCGQPLFLEWAPIGSLKDADEVVQEDLPAHPFKKSTTATPKSIGDDEDEGQAATSSTAAATSGGGKNEDVSELAKKTQNLTLFVTNLPFNVTEDDFVTFLQDACSRLSKGFSTMITRVNLQADRGRCFITCADQTTFSYVLSKLNGKKYASRVLSCVASKSASTPIDTAAAGKHAPAEEDDYKAASSQPAASVTGVPHGCNPLKLIVKNLPFEATEKDLRELFSAFTEIKAVRVPRKINQFGAHRDNNHRGFGFVEFLTETEAAAALKALSSTHLYGRHLVLQYAKQEAE